MCRMLEFLLASPHSFEAFPVVSYVQMKACLYVSVNDKVRAREPRKKSVFV